MCASVSMQKGQSILFKAKGQNGKPAPGLSVEGTVNSGSPASTPQAHFILSGHATISLSPERWGVQGIWLQIKWDKGCKDTHNTYTFILYTHTQTQTGTQTCTHQKSCLQRAFKSFGAMQTHTRTHTYTHTHTHTHNISAHIQCQSSHGFSSALFVSWLRNRARPLMPIPPSNPLSFNKRPGQAGGSARSPSVFYQSWTTEQHSPLLKVYGSWSYLCVQLEGNQWPPSEW